MKDWSDLRIAVEAGRWLGQAQANDLLDIVSDDQAFDAVEDVAAAHGVAFRRLSGRSIQQYASGTEQAAPARRSARRRTRQRRRRVR